MAVTQYPTAVVFVCVIFHFSAFQCPECDLTLVCHLHVFFIKSLSLNVYMCMFSTESIGDDKK